MDVNSLFQALTNASATAQKDNPFQPFEDLSQNVGGLILKQSTAPGASMGETVVASLLDGLMGGVGSRLSDTFAANQGDLARNVLMDAMQGRALSRPDGMNPSVFSGLQNSAQLYNLQKQQDVKDAIQKAAITTEFTNPAEANYLQSHGVDVKGYAFGDQSKMQDPFTKTAIDAKNSADAAQTPSPHDDFLAQVGLGKDVPSDTSTAGSKPLTSDSATIDDLARLIKEGKVGEANALSLDMAAGDRMSGKLLYTEAQKKVEESNPLNPKNRASQQTVGAISNAYSTIAQLEKLKERAKNAAPGSGFDYVDGLYLDASSAMNPGSAAATYDSSVIPLTDRLLRALTEVGRGSQYNLEKILNDLQTARGKGPQAISDRIDNYIEDLKLGAEQKTQDLIATGYTGASPLLGKSNGGNGKAETKTINGAQYMKVQGGWKKLGAPTG